MSNPSSRSYTGPIILSIVIFLVLASWTHGSSRDTTMSQESSSQPAVALSKLAIRIRQTQTSPPTLALSVTNDNTSPLTILRWGTPLDPMALQLGVLSVTPEGKDAPLELPTIALRRVMPPRDEDKVTLHPGESRENEVVLRETMLPFEELGKTARVAAKGNWQAVWPTTADRLSTELVEKLQFGEGVLTGEFETEAVEITIPQ
ncbi:hypothetical protein CMUS01_00897 [Colletotrichum musicola]|uniref:Secreted protein n=1 Tax=Colletotrichum musicola TaxID=2175873 RepID=A0A8H6NXS9_9PEZI|nr:hypothetical protein CMUS01_00897 [Colletotrichum musicola]